ncbi:MAG: metalloregulator ArsR/SmtB family transcription factor [Planctomycetes bacterium]|nr:metalloregulator ArsR/SmtB family transcription factor [Planctomycetota bacterium]
MNATEAARLFKCLSEGLRVRILALLAEEELNGNELRQILEVPQSTLSRHLNVLKEAGLVSSRREGSWTFFRFDRPEGLNGSSETLLDLLADLTAADDGRERDRRRLAEVLEERRRGVREHFDLAGHTWDEFHAAVADHAVKEQTLRYLVPRDLVLVDAGCGSGYLLPELAATGARVLAIDNAPAQLARAQRSVDELGLGGIEFLEGDLQHLPLADAAADGVFAHLSLHHAARPELAIRELTRVLRPGGSLVITDFVAHQESWLREEHADLWMGFTPRDVESWMRAAGLVEIDREERPYARQDGPAADLARNLKLFILSGRMPPSPERNNRT